MQITIDLDPETYRACETKALEEKQSTSALIASLVRRFVPSKPSLKPEERVLTNAELEYQIPVVKGGRAFTSEDVARMEEEDDLR